MRRLIPIGLVLCLLVALAGCSKPPPESPPQLSLSETIDLLGTIQPTEPDARLELAEKQNKDAVAWLTVPGTTIDDAVYQSVDNDYYLRRDALGEYSLEGSYFADFECHFESAEDLSRNTIIYGHTFEGDDERRFFGQLHRYIEDEAWALENRLIKLSTADAMLTYKIVSAAEIPTGTDSLAIKPSPTLDEFSEIATQAIERSVFDFGTTPAECGSLLTLSTCTGDYATRLLVVARLVSI